MNRNRKQLSPSLEHQNFTQCAAGVNKNRQLSQLSQIFEAYKNKTISNQTIFDYILHSLQVFKNDTDIIDKQLWIISEITQSPSLQISESHRGILSCVLEEYISTGDTCSLKVDSVASFIRIYCNMLSFHLADCLSQFKELLSFLLSNEDLQAITGKIIWTIANSLGTIIMIDDYCLFDDFKDYLRILLSCVSQTNCLKAKLAIIRLFSSIDPSLRSIHFDYRPLFKACMALEIEDFPDLDQELALNYLDQIKNAIEANGDIN